jgi:hypothetical protein
LLLKPTYRDCLKLIVVPNGRKCARRLISSSANGSTQGAKSPTGEDL